MIEDKCTYCGFGADLEREHVIPAVWYSHRSFDPNKQWIVAGCRQCNLLAGSHMVFSVPEKAKYLYKRYKSRFSKILKTPIWTPEELREVDYKLRVVIEEAQIQKVMLSRRVEHLEFVGNMPLDYKRPEWVEKDMIQMEKDYKKLLASIKRHAKDKKGREKDKKSS